ncbi:MAG: glycerol kinase GlpK [Mycobacteriales bacterium]
MAEFVGAIDQGTTSTRFMVFNHDGLEVGRHQAEHRQILPRAGWVEHDPAEIVRRCRECVEQGLAAAGIEATDLAAIGITNQRETTVVWDRGTGEPLHHAIVWQDTRTDRIIAALERDGHADLIRERTGLPPATYFAGAKITWLLDNVDGLRERAARAEIAVGTVDSWLLATLGDGRHCTDVTNASRTMLMDLRELAWDDEMLALLSVPREILPEITPSASPDAFGVMRINGTEVPVAAVLGDQHAATVGQTCFAAGEAKNTYGTGNFLVLNTGSEIVRSEHGLLSTVGYRFGEQPVVYAAEGSVAVTGSAVQWLRDQLGVIDSAAQSADLAATVDDTGGVYFVPAFSGLFAPYWRSDARGTIVGLTRYSTKAHLARATLESICWQTRDVVEAMIADGTAAPAELRVDGGVTANDVCMQLQADALGIPVTRPAVAETTALGAAYAAGLATGFWRDQDELRAKWVEDARWEPRWSRDRRDAGYADWRRAVERSMGWASTEG